jgi:hypothetical protein
LLLVFLLFEVFPLEAELFDFEAEPLDFDSSALALISLPTPATFAPASTAPLNAPVAAPIAAPLTTSVKASVAFATIPFDELFFVFFPPEELLAVEPPLDFDEDLLADDFELAPDDLPADFELEPVDLLDDAFEPEDLPADDFEAPPVDLLAVDFPAEEDLPADLLAELDFAAVFKPEDLPAADFDADFAEAVSLVAVDDLLDDDLPLDDLPLDAVDFPEFLLLFVVAIAFSLKFFLQLTQEFLR